jgi:D-glycero-alpha-D-manno-heptose-7-phosphate kinase
MAFRYTSVKKILETNPVEVSAPCRVDSGGTWDIKALAIPLERIVPVTVNIAINLRTRVRLSPFKDEHIKISSDGFEEYEEYNIKSNLPFKSAFGLFLATVNYFGFHGLEVTIHSDSPVKSALGGSSTALVALIKALSRLQVQLGEKDLTRSQILHMGYHIEDGISGGNCGMQDQAAAVYGGVNLWSWTYGNKSHPFSRETLIKGQDMTEISQCITVAFSGKSHVSARVNRSWVNDFLSGRTRTGWIEANEVVKRLAASIKEKDWISAAGLLRDEMKIRKKITPDALIPLTSELIHRAEKIGCGARFTGAGAGGSLWAIGEPDKIRAVEGIWGKILSQVKGAGILRCSVDPVGIKQDPAI